MGKRSLTAAFVKNAKDAGRYYDNQNTGLHLYVRKGGSKSWIQRVRLIWIPQLEPFLFTALRTGLSLTWKIILVVELLGRSSGIGFQVHLYFQLFEVDMILAYALSFMIAMQLIEWVAVRPLEQRVQQWRKDDQLA